MNSRVLIVNPNTSERCSEGIRAAALANVGKGIGVDVVTANDGPAYIETLRDEVVAASAVMRLLEEGAGAADGIIIACSSDPGLEAARETYDIPVLGIGESALLLAWGTGRAYGIVTNLESDRGYFWTVARRYRLAGRLVAVEASGYTVEDFDLRREGVVDGLLGAARRAVDAGARSLCLGCAAMAGLDRDVAASVQVPVFEGVASAAQLVTAYLLLRPSVPTTPELGGSHAD